MFLFEGHRLFKHNLFICKTEVHRAFHPGKNPHGFSFKALNICYGITHHSQTQAVVFSTNVNLSFN